ncbi:MAG: hypothetical protein ABSF14_11610 [Terriglobia bacterium]|jgi:hypothetical protein
MAPNNENAMFLQRMKDPRLRPLWRLTHTLIKVRNGALTQKDVKNEDRTDYVYENKCESDNMSCYRADLLADNSRIAR